MIGYWLRIGNEIPEDQKYDTSYAIRKPKSIEF
jgi:hypothetical protein